MREGAKVQFKQAFESVCRVPRSIDLWLPELSSEMPNGPGGVPWKSDEIAAWLDARPRVSNLIDVGAGLGSPPLSER